MPLLLGIETATKTCSVALTANGQVLALKESSGANEHSSLLTQYIQDVLQTAGIQAKEIDAVAVSIGPGSYTGLRIGLSTAKGLCYALNKPLIAIPTLKAIAHRAIITSTSAEIQAENSVLIPLIDARRMEAFTTFFSSNLTEIAPVQALLIDDNSFDDLHDKKIFLFGDGAEKCKSLFAHKSGFFFPEVNPSATSICLLAEESFKQKEFANLAYSEPFYLKDFIAGKPRVKGLYD